MGATLWCSQCGLEAPIGKGELEACTACGWRHFTDDSWAVKWTAQLTHNDRRLLRSLRISPA